MWISKKKWKELEKRVTDLECRIQGQLVDSKAINDELARQKLAFENYFENWSKSKRQSFSE